MQHLPEGQGRGGGFFSGSARGAFLPQGQTDEQHRREKDLEQGNVPVTGRPRHSACQRRTHDHGADHGADAPHTVQPAHMAALVVQSHVVVQGGVHAAGPQTVGDGPQAEHPELPRHREAEQGRSSHAHTDGGDFAGAEGAGETVAIQAGDDGAQRDDHGNDPRIGHRHTQLRVHGGPRRPQQGVRQTQTDECHIDDGQEQ